jgi:hypothetical protein
MLESAMIVEPIPMKGPQGVLISRVVHLEVNTENPGQIFFAGYKAGHGDIRCRVVIHARLRITLTIWAGIRRTSLIGQPRNQDPLWLLDPHFGTTATFSNTDERPSAQNRLRPFGPEFLIPATGGMGCFSLPAPHRQRKNIFFFLLGASAVNKMDLFKK